MKRTGKVTAVVVALTLAAVGFMGCAGGPERDPDAFFTVDFEALGLPIRSGPLAGNWADFLIPFPEFEGVDFNDFGRVTIRAVAINEEGNVMPPADSMIMVTLIYDLGGDIRGPAEGPGPNTPLKQFNVGGPMGTVHGNRGVALNLNRAPGGILFQNANAAVQYIEVLEVTFHNR